MIVFGVFSEWNLEFHTNMLIIIFARLFFNKVKIFNRIKGKIPFRCGGPYNNLVLTNNENDQIQFEPNEFHFHSAVFLENPVPLSHNLGVIQKFQSDAKFSFETQILIKIM